MIEQRYLRYAHKSSFDYDLRNGLIMDESIVFIDDAMLIWTHGKIYQGFEGYDVNKMLGLLEAGNLQIKTWNDEPTPSKDEIDIINKDTIQTALKKVETRLKDDVLDINSRILVPDEVDLTQIDLVLKLKEYHSNPINFHSYGHIILKENLQGLGTSNVLSQAVINENNTIYEIKMDFDLNGYTLTMPEGSSLFFNGGTLSNGKIVGSNNSYIFGYVNPNKISLTKSTLVGVLPSVTIENFKNLDGTLFTSKTFGESTQRPKNEMNGFIFYDTTIKKLIVWDGNANVWNDVYGNPVTIDNYGYYPETITDKVQTTFLYKDSSDFWKEISKQQHDSRWIIKNNEGGWDVLANTDIASITMDGLMSAEDKLWLEGEDGHPENGAKERLNNVELEIAAIREDFLISQTFIANSTFTDLLDCWKTQKTKQVKIQGSIDNLVIKQDGNAEYKDIFDWIIPEEIINDMEGYLKSDTYEQKITKEQAYKIIGANKMRLETSFSVDLQYVGKIYNENGGSSTFTGEIKLVDGKYIIDCVTDDYDGYEIPLEYIPDNFELRTAENLEFDLNCEQVNNIFGTQYISPDVQAHIVNTGVYEERKYNKINPETGENEEHTISLYKCNKHLIMFTLLSTINHKITLTVTRGGKRLFTFGKKTSNVFGRMLGNYIQCDSLSLNSLLSDHRGSTYAISKDARSSVCIDNNFITQMKKDYIHAPEMQLSNSGLYIPTACTLKFYYFVERAGDLEIYFQNESKNAKTENVIAKEYQVFHEKIHLDTSKSWNQYVKEFNWNGYGDFTIKFTGKIYIHTIACAKNDALQLQHNYDELHSYAFGASARFDGFDNSFDPNDIFVESPRNSFVEAEQVIYISNLKRFLGVYHDDLDEVHYTTVWNSVDMYMDRLTDKIFKNKIYICQDKIYLYDLETDGLKKYSSDNNDHLINVDESGFYIVDQNGYVAFKVDNEGIEYAKDLDDNPEVEELKLQVSGLLNQIKEMQDEIDRLKTNENR